MKIGFVVRASGCIGLLNALCAVQSYLRLHQDQSALVVFTEGRDRVLGMLVSWSHQGNKGALAHDKGSDEEAFLGAW